MSTSFNATKDMLGHYVSQAASTSAEILAVLLKSTGLETDGAIADHATLTALLAAANDEADFTNYSRLTCASPTRTVDNTGDRVLLSVTSPLIWASAGGATNNAVGKLLYVYDPNPGTSTDTTRLPLLAVDITYTTTGDDLVVTIHADGIARIRNP